MKQMNHKRPRIPVHGERREAATVAGFGSIGWHTFRHKYRTLLSEADLIPSFNTNYSLKPGRIMSVCAYLSGPVTGTTNGNADSISTNGVQAKFNGAGNYVSFDSNTACGMGSGLVGQTFTATATNHTGVQNNSVALQIMDSVKVPDTYVGVLSNVGLSMLKC
jgi:hypothetical protein